MRTATALAILAALPFAGTAAGNPDAKDAPVLQEWPVEWGGRTRDPYVAPDGKVWLVGQAGNYIASFDPESESFRRYEIEDGTNPHNLIVDQEGYVWYAGNRNGRIGKLDPKSGIAAIHLTGEARDPHTLVFDGKGNIWFTSQQSNRIGRLDMKTGEYQLVTPYESPARPYGIVLDGKGNPWVALFNTPHVARIDPKSLEVTRFQEMSNDSRARRLDITSDGAVWYGDEERGFLGRIDPASGKVKEYPMPGGADSRPYALTKDGAGRLWISQTGPEKKLVAFDPKSGKFVAVLDVSGNIRHMMYDARTDAMWFGTDANRVGRVITGRAVQ
jgi:virginiamycin B lyase